MSSGWDGDRLSRHARARLSREERDERSSEDDRERDPHRWMHRVDERVREDVVRNLPDLRGDIRGHTRRQLERRSALTRTDLEALLRGVAESVDERRAHGLGQLR